MTDVRFPVEAGHILQFARAIGDDNPAFHGAMTGVLEGVVAPPTFVQASAHYDPDYPLRPQPGRPWFGSGSGDGSAPSGGGGLHAEQHFEYHKPVRSGMVLTVTRRDGGTWEKEGRRGGRLHFTETITEFRDERGDLVVTARSVGVRTGRVVTQEG
ncbi:MAG: MaoC family dehydratase N-terminal domain-containing protein [Micromonosporaceae bacterium]